MLLFQPDGIWLGVGSDHTDREAETIDINLSKQLCPKPVGRDLWPLDDVTAHWDRLTLRSILEAGQRVFYQEDNLAEILHPDILFGKFPEDLRSLPHGTLFMCGTPPAKGGIRPAARFEMELEDPGAEPNNQTRLRCARPAAPTILTSAAGEERPCRRERADHDEWPRCLVGHRGFRDHLGLSELRCSPAAFAVKELLCYPTQCASARHRSTSSRLDEARGR